MNFLIYSERLAYLHDLAVKGGLRSPEQLCAKFECSERTIRRMIHHLRQRGVHIEYDKKRKKYIVSN
ncbi:HTH domain-containing protein [Chryseolinea serpens]|uniref:HTH domain-containing protein n=1 Tax=Chryseolinea serpens TaxID=947013 RepID=A0A1M5LIA3_9BACT|nr:HTH domain-containing protein [Chryseolinea serpens]